MKLQKRLLAILLAVTLLTATLTGCGLFTAPEGTDADENPEVTPGPIPIDLSVPCDGSITIAYVPSDAINPYTSTSRDNLSVAGLIYEGLYALGENFTAVPTLAQGLTTLDGRRYTLEIQSGITFHNGTQLTVEDVIYSLNRARNSTLFGGRLDIISGYERRYDADGTVLDYEMDITLTRVHGNLPVLLTFPIIRQGTFGWNAPPGTGPYSFVSEDGPPRLISFAEHRYSAYLPIDTIYLEEVITMEQMTAHFNSGTLDILALELTAVGEPRLAASREMRHFEAGLMDYVGFNIRRPEVRQAEVRQAISYAIDRVYITDNIMRGNAVASTLPLHPSLFYYDHMLAADFSFDLNFARQILAGEATLDRPEWQDENDEGDEGGDAHIIPPPAPDTPADGPAEDADEEDGEEDEEEPPPVQLTLLVASGNTNRMEVAVYIAANIAELGYQVIVDDRPYNEFLAALEAGDFDLFYGQVRLQPDFDLTELLFGSLAFGGVSGLVDRWLIDDFLASGQADRAERAYRMCREILTEVPFVVIGFRHLSVATQRGVVVGMQPTQENVYQNVWEWIINLPSQEEAEVE
ncbi:MAG: ABC transporter substrate-binding protein [Oscillospiraceae bacterium]|nr:ABC transporter substrate-binding protein [Oscillospiraceae bacterium]